MLNLKELFEKHDKEFLAFEREANPPHPCPDICALLLLSELSPVLPGRDIIGGATHDDIWFESSPEDVAKNATEPQIITLIRCGVCYSESHNVFTMFV